MSDNLDSAADQELSLRALLPLKEVQRLCSSLSVILGSDVALQQLDGSILGGTLNLCEDNRVDLVLEIEPIGYLIAPGAAPLMRGAIASLVRQLLIARARYLMASGIHIASTRTAYEDLQREHAALKESEARYKSLSEELEARVIEQVKVIDERQRQLYQSERLASVGQLAAGVAHEINNPIGFVRSNLNSAQKYLAKIGNLAATVKALPGGEGAWIKADMPFMLEDFGELLTECIDGADRVSRIVADLKGFSNVDKPEQEFADLNKVLDGVCTIFGKDLPDDVRLARNFEARHDMRVLCLPGHLAQSFLAVLTNAAQALAGRGSAGEIAVTTHFTSEWFSVEISDNGVGAPADVLARAFDPFFTTRPVGKGTGLGLTVARDVVRAHGGEIEISSTPGAGTRVTMKLPSVTLSADANSDPGGAPQ